MLLSETMSLACKDETDSSGITTFAFFLSLPIVFSPLKKGILGVISAVLGGSMMTI